MAATSWVPVITAGATLAGVALGSWLSGLRETRQATQRRRWDVEDRNRSERREVYLRFLNAADDAVHLAWETGRKRTTVHSRAEGQQHFLDWVPVRDELSRVLTEVRLAAPAHVHLCAAQVRQRAVTFGEQALLAGTGQGMEEDPASHQRKYDTCVTELIEAMEGDLRSD